MNTKNKFKVMFSFIFLVVGLLMLFGCIKKSFTVKYVIGNTEYKQVEYLKNITRQLPEEPKGQNGEYFDGWYIDKEFKERFEIKQNFKTNQLTVYGRFLKITFEGSIKDETETIKVTYDDVFDESKWPTKENFVFSGWYTDEKMTTKITQEHKDVKKIYGKFVVRITLDLGYETLTRDIDPNTAFEKPSVEEIKRDNDFIDETDIYFLNSNNEKITFPIIANINTTIKVSWKTPFIQFYRDTATDLLYITDFNDDDEEKLRKFPVVSYPHYVTYEGKEEKVTGIISNGNGNLLGGIGNKAIIREGIKSLYNFNSNALGAVEEVILPDSLVVIENSFNGFRSLKKLNIPQNVEVIIESFWQSGVTKNTVDDFYPFVIEIPKSVKSLSVIPRNLKFKEGSTFSYDDKGNIIQTLGSEKILIASRMVDIYTHVIPDGITAIKVGAFCFAPGIKTPRFNEIDKIIIPASFKKIAYNPNATEYSYAIPKNGHLSSFKKLTSANKVDTANMELYSYVIFNTISFTKLIFKVNDLPFEELKGAIVDETNNAKYEDYPDNCIFDGPVEAGQVATIKVQVIDYILETARTENFNYTSGHSITLDILKAKIGLNSTATDSYLIKEITEFGIPVDYFNNSYMVNKNLNLVVKYTNSKLGFTYEKNSDNTLTVTGFDKDTALLTSLNGYVVNIPDVLYDLSKPENGMKITHIKPFAFKGVQEIQIVHIGANIIEIGEGAFDSCVNLVKVIFETTNLQYIRKRAFADTTLTTVSFPLKNLKDIEPFAFKIKTLESFIPVSDEDGYILIDFTLHYFYKRGNYNKNVKKGNFLYIPTISSKYPALIVKVTGVNETILKQKKSQNDESLVDVPVVDVQLVASAAKYSDNYNIALGISGRKGELYMLAKNTCVRFEIMPGSLYYMTVVPGENLQVTFGIIKKVHKEAFTDIDKKIFETETVPNGDIITKYIKLYKLATDNVYGEWIKKEDFFNKEIFEEGWIDLPTEIIKKAIDNVAIVTSAY